MINIPTTMLIGIALVIFAFNLALPITALSGTVMRSTLGIAMASVLLAFLMMITRSKAIPQVIGFLAMENGLFFAATSATYGMPMVVELGVALDVLVGVFVLGIFFFQIRETFDSLDLKHMEKLRKNDHAWSPSPRPSPARGRGGRSRFAVKAKRGNLLGTRYSAARRRLPGALGQPEKRARNQCHVQSADVPGRGGADPAASSRRGR